MTTENKNNATATLNPNDALAKMAQMAAQMEALQAQVAAAQVENERLKARTAGPLSLRVSEKGAVSLYGIQRFPVTLYQDQWAKLIAFAAEITKFIGEQKPGVLSEKAPKVGRPETVSTKG